MLVEWYVCLFGCLVTAMEISDRAAPCTGRLFGNKDLQGFILSTSRVGLGVSREKDTTWD
jgi:hypothetical protein